MKKPLSSEAASRLRDHALSETEQGRIISATDYPLHPEDFPEGEERAIVRGISKLQEVGFFDTPSEMQTQERPAASHHWEISPRRENHNPSEER